LEQIIKKNIFRQYDIRGKVPTEFDVADVKIIVKHFVNLIKNFNNNKNITIAVGRDIRLTSEDFSNATIESIINSGCNVIDLGVCPTPLTYFSSFVLEDITATIMITGSHNPPEYNGLKFSFNKKAFFGDDIQRLLKSILKNKNFENNSKGKYEHINIKKLYFKWIEEHFISLKEKNNLSKIKIAVDASNGTASTIVPIILKKFGINTIPLFCEENGTFPNHPPDPTIEQNLKTLKEIIMKENADFGVAFDGDSDRVVFLDEKGKMLYGDEAIYIFALNSATTSEKNKTVEKNNTVILDVKSSQTIINALKKNNINVDVYKSGHSLIKNRLNELNANLAGETSAHIFFADRFFGYDDGIYAMMRMLEIYAKKKEDINFKFSDFLKHLPQRVITPEIRINYPDNKKFIIIDKIKKILTSEKEKEYLNVTEILELDGIRLHFTDGWALIRPSNTEPAITLRFEATTMTKLEFYKTYILQILNNMK
jgi:phosphomannomutase/phosphoglucomutase